MARIIRASLVLMLLLVTACRYGSARQEALFRFAVSAILNTAAATEGPAAAEPAKQVKAVQQAAVVPPVIPAAMRMPSTECPSIRVAAIAIPAAELRPAVEIASPLFRPEAVSLERRIAMTRVRIARIDRVVRRREIQEAQNARCREAARIRAEALMQELRAAHLILPAEEGSSCPLDSDASEAFPATEIESLRAIGG